MKKNINIFVYGSLREGFYNYDKYLKEKITSIRQAKIDDMIIYHMPYKGYPAMFNGDGTVYGEIIEIIPDIYDDVISAMDIMEGFISENNPKNEYHKKIMEVKDLNNGRKEYCYTYYYNHVIDDKFEKEAILINHGNWAKYMTENQY